MINPMQSFDVNNGAATNFAIGKQIGSANSPFTPLGQVLDGMIAKYDAAKVAQTGHANAMELQGSKNQTDIDVAKIGAGYGLDGSAPPKATPPKVIWQKGPDGRMMYSTQKSNAKGQEVYSDFGYAPKEPSAKEVFTNNLYEGLNAEEQNPIQQGASQAVDVSVDGLPPLTKTIPVPAAQTPKTLSPDIVKGFLQQAGGDRAKAKARALQAGYTF